MAKAKPPAEQTNDPTATPATEKKRARQKSEYVIESMIDSANNDATGSAAVPTAGTFKDTASAIKWLQNPSNGIGEGKYRVVVVKWQKSVKQVQQTITQFE